MNTMTDAEKEDAANNNDNKENDENTGNTDQSKNSRTDNQIPLAQDIIDAVKEIWKRGNASRLDIEKGGKIVLSIPLTVGAIGLVLAPMAALIGIGAALITEYTIKITLDDGTVVNVNEFVVTRKTSTEPKDAKDAKDAKDVTPDENEKKEEQ
jgi:hypothetical protein